MRGNVCLCGVPAVQDRCMVVVLLLVYVDLECVLRGPRQLHLSNPANVRTHDALGSRSLELCNVALRQT